MQNSLNKNLRSTIVSTLFLTLLAVLLAASAQAAENQNDLTVEVNVSERTIIDIQPKTFSWGTSGAGIDPGTVAGPNDEASEYGRIQIENLGSVNITEVWFNSSYPSQRPFGTGDATKYDAGNFIALDSNDSGVTDSNQFVNRKEYGLDQPDGKDIIYLNTNNDWDYGRFRTTSQEYFWTVDDTTADLSGNTFRIGNEPHNESQTGSTDLAGTCDFGDETGGSTGCNGYDLSTTTVDGNDWAYTDVEIGAQDSTTPTTVPEENGGQVYCAVMNATQVKADGASERPGVWFVKWNPQFGPGLGSLGDCGTVTNYTVGTGAEYNSITPGDWITRNIRARVPYGVVAGDQLGTGNLWVLANSN